MGVVSVLGDLATSITIQMISNMAQKPGVAFIALQSSTPGLNGPRMYGDLNSIINVTVIGDQVRLMFVME